jgi:hypothetical protein
VTRRVALACVALLALSSTCRADGLDLYAWVVRLPPGSNALVVLAAIAAILVVDYALNFLVVGWAASKWSTVGRRQVARDLVLLTLFGQVADRAGAILGLIFGSMTDPLYPHSSEASFLLPLVVANFVCTAVLIALLVVWFARKKWSITGKRSWGLAVPAGILTNPMIPLILFILLQR